MNVLLRQTSLAACFVLSVAATARSVEFTVLDANFGRTPVDISQIDSRKAVGRTPQGAWELPLRDVILLQQRSTGSPTQNADKLQLVLRNGERLTGTVAGFANDAVTWNSATLGQRQVPLAQIERVVRGNAQENLSLSPEEASRDVLLLANGDHASGIITAMDEKTVSVQSADGQTVNVEWSSIRQIHLAAAGDAAASSGNWRVWLGDGSVVDVESIQLDQRSIKLTRQEQTSTLPIAQVRSVENLAGRARLLVRQAPASQEYAPYFPRTGHEQTLPVPEEVPIGNAKTRAFIPARPYSRITFNIEGDPSLFKTRYALADTGPMANCQVRVWLDDKMVLDKPGLTADGSLGTFETPVGNAKTLSLEVDFGENFDIQDQVYWIEPAFIWQ